MRKTTMRSDDSWKRDYAHIFPRFVAVSVWRGEELQLLYREERELVRNVAPARVREFAAGRQCARRALSTLGIDGAALLFAANRAPEWPDGIVGSISHTIGFCVAVACRSCDAIGVGVDVERIERASWEIAQVLCTPTERSRIAAMPRGGGAALLLSAKESLFKAYQPLTGFCLSLSDIDVTFDPTSGRYAACLVNDSAPSLFGVREFCGRYRIDERYVYTGLVLPWKMTQRCGG